MSGLLLARIAAAHRPSGSPGGGGGASLYSNGFETDANGITGTWARTTAWAASGTYSLGSTNHGGSSSSAAQLTVSPARGAFVSFDWNAASELNFDKLTVTANSTNILTSSAALSSGRYLGFFEGTSLALVFTYTKDATGNTGLDQVFIDNLTVSEILDAGPITFETNADQVAGDWVRTTAWKSVGTYSLGSSNAAKPSSTSSATIKRYLSTAKTLMLDWYVQGETNFDKLTITVNGVVQVNGVSSSTGTGGTVSVAVPSGIVTIVASYSKDSSGNIGLDQGFIDNIRFV